MVCGLFERQIGILDLQPISRKKPDIELIKYSLVLHHHLADVQVKNTLLLKKFPSKKTGLGLLGCKKFHLETLETGLQNLTFRPRRSVKIDKQT